MEILEYYRFKTKDDRIKFVKRLGNHMHHIEKYREIADDRNQVIVYYPCSITKFDLVSSVSIIRGMAKAFNGEYTI